LTFLKGNFVIFRWNSDRFCYQEYGKWFVGILRIIFIKVKKNIVLLLIFYQYMKKRF